MKNRPTLSLALYLQSIYIQFHSHLMRLESPPPLCRTGVHDSERLHDLAEVTQRESGKLGSDLVAMRLFAWLSPTQTDA